MIATIAEKKVQRSETSAIVVAAIAGEWFPYDHYMIAAIDRLTFFVEKYEAANWSLRRKKIYI